jgi:hypothetical protein
MSFHFTYRESLKYINAYVQDPKTAKPALRQPKLAAVAAAAGPSDDSSEFLSRIVAGHKSSFRPPHACSLHITRAFRGLYI